MTWDTRDLPVLRAIVEASDEGVEHVEAAEIAKRTGFDDDTVQSALWALAGEQPEFFRHVDASSMQGRYMHAAFQPTGHARRTVGTWPSPEQWADLLVKALEEAADNEHDEVKRGKLRKLADDAGAVGQSVLSDVIAAVVTRSAGM